VKAPKPVQQPKEKAAAPEAGEKEEPIPTAMEMALREAMERSKTNQAEQRAKSRRKAPGDDEMERILSRTLQHKSRSGK
jgi:hypothetical protein